LEIRLLRWVFIISLGECLLLDERVKGDGDGWRVKEGCWGWEMNANRWCQNSKAEFDTAIKDNKVVILDAFATWCGPCKVIAPQVVKYVPSLIPSCPSSLLHHNTPIPHTNTPRFSDDFPSAHFVKVDVDEVPDVAQELGIRAMPTFLIFKNGEKAAEVVGANPKALLAAIQEATKE
jgi:thioredoxin 1